MIDDTSTSVKTIPSGKGVKAVKRSEWLALAHALNVAAALASFAGEATGPRGARWALHVSVALGLVLIQVAD